ncbi:uncharacterized protein LOC110024316 isoform X2 [Phalaenopsis equestris]|uniref:uncharacterized protein LOC110024316 isoform X2 n=1 Tax=Phalaenopsis equestris TaxID=78828 RepID=UPI0009E5DAFB|nr:uncharacterized protein LOC110024316 isoform X2 [Phalaenopsis equestris]
MDAAIFSFFRSLAAFCNHVESSSKALSDSVQRSPIPLDSAAAAFLQSLEHRMSTTISDLSLLNSMAFDTVSFEELLGYCNEVYKANEKHISEVEDIMRSFGYVPDTGPENEEFEEFGADVRLSDISKGFDGVGSAMKTPSLEDELYNDSISLKNFGLSEASLAALASKDSLDSSGGASMKAEIMISEDDYDKLPAIMKKLSSWEELQEAVNRFNSYISGNDGSNKNGIFDQGVLEKLGLGRKGKTYLLLLLRMNRLPSESLEWLHITW